MRDATFEVAPGEYLALMGPSDSGKSTLLNVLGLLTGPTSGDYYLNGVEVGSLTERGAAGIRAQWIGPVFRSVHLLTDRPAVANVAVGALYGGRQLRRAAIRGRALDAFGPVRKIIPVLGAGVPNVR